MPIKSKLPPVNPGQEAAALATYSRHPTLAVRLLEAQGGDVLRLAALFAKDLPAQTAALTRILRSLNKPGNEEHKERWVRLIESYKEAKELVAEGKAFNFIGNYEPPVMDEKANLASFVTYARFWLAGRQASETVKGKKAGGSVPVRKDKNELGALAKRLLDLEEDGGTN